MAPNIDLVSQKNLDSVKLVEIRNLKLIGGYLEYKRVRRTLTERRKRIIKEFIHLTCKREEKKGTVSSLHQILGDAEWRRQLIYRLNENQNRRSKVNLRHLKHWLKNSAIFCQNAIKPKEAEKPKLSSSVNPQSSSSSHVKEEISDDESSSSSSRGSPTCSTANNLVEEEATDASGLMNALVLHEDEIDYDYQLTPGTLQVFGIDENGERVEAEGTPDPRRSVALVDIYSHINIPRDAFSPQLRAIFDNVSYGGNVPQFLTNIAPNQLPANIETVQILVTMLSGVVANMEGRNIVSATLYDALCSGVRFLKNELGTAWPEQPQNSP